MSDVFSYLVDRPAPKVARSRHARVRRNFLRGGP